MMKLIGAVLVAAGGTALGLCAAERLKSRERALDEICQGLQLLEQELLLDCPPLEELFERLTGCTEGTSRTLFERCAVELRQRRKSVPQLWQEAVWNCTELGPEGCAGLAGLGNFLGRSDCEHQQEAVEQVRLRMDELRRRAGQNRREKEKLFQILGVSGGTFLAVLLL